MWKMIFNQEVNDSHAFSYARISPIELGCLPVRKRYKQMPTVCYAKYCRWLEYGNKRTLGRQFTIKKIPYS